MNVVTLPVVVPLATAALSLFFRPGQWRSRVCLFSSFVQVALGIWFVFLTAGGERLGVSLGGWKAPVGITLVMDSLSAALVLMASICLAASSLFTTGEKHQQTVHPLRMPLMQFLLVGVHLAFITGDFFNLFVSFEVMLVASYALLSLESKEKQTRLGLSYVVLNIVGSSLFLCLAGFVYGAWGTLNYADLSARLMAETSRGHVLVFAFVSVLVFGLKAGLFPLYYWLPLSYPIMPSAVSGLFAALLTKVGVYVLLRLFCTILPEGLWEVYLFIGVLSVASMVLGGFGALAQKSVRGILSFHILSQVGYMTLCLAMPTPMAITGAILFLYHQMMVKGSLFLIGGSAQAYQGSDALPQMGGLWKSQFILGLLFFLQAFSLAGLPPLSGFWGKWLIVQEGIRQEAYWYVGGSLLAGVFTLVSMLKLGLGVFWGESKTIEPERPITAQGFLAMKGAAALLTVCALFMGVGFYWSIPWARQASLDVLDSNGYRLFVQSLATKHTVHEVRP
jgi:multicomponent Na+:H+ antiporter subunit D